LTPTSTPTETATARPPTATPYPTRTPLPTIVPAIKLLPSSAGKGGPGSEELGEDSGSVLAYVMAGVVVIVVLGSAGLAVWWIRRRGTVGEG
jgi:hypothetical protein